MPVLEATGAAAEAINDHISATPCPIAWRAFQRKNIAEEVLKTWYYELKDELTAIRDADL